MPKAPPKLVAHSVSTLDWDFDGVADSELVACCYWEYARESLGIRELHRRGFQPDFWGEIDS